MRNNHRTRGLKLKFKVSSKFEGVLLKTPVVFFEVIFEVIATTPLSLT